MLKAYPEPRDGPISLEVVNAATLISEYLSRPKDEMWQLACFACSQDVAYWVALDDLRTERQALATTLHLSDKVWFSETAHSWRNAVEALFPDLYGSQ